MYQFMTEPKECDASKTQDLLYRLLRNPPQPEKSRRASDQNSQQSTIQVYLSPKGGFTLPEHIWH